MKRMIFLLMAMVLTISYAAPPIVDVDVGNDIEYVMTADAVQSEVVNTAEQVAVDVYSFTAPIIGLTYEVATRTIDNENISNYYINKTSDTKNGINDNNDLVTLSREVDYPLLFSSFMSAGTNLSA